MSMRASDTLRSQQRESTDEQHATVAAEAALPPLPFPAEIFRQIYVSLDLPSDRGPVIGVTSAIRGEGCTTVALGLAQTLSSDLDMSVLLVDADMDRSSLADRIGVSTSPGLGAVLRRKVSLSDAMRQVSEHLYVVASPSPEAESARLLRELSDRDLFESRQAVGAVTILDLPPVLNHSYSSVAASLADALVLVIRAGATPMGLVQEAIDRLKGRPLQGAVFNGDGKLHLPREPKRKKKDAREGRA
jgi:Mrp family chromosome partitioning ATPase